MASGSRAAGRRGPRTPRGAPAAIAAAAPAPVHEAVPGARFADLPAADLVGLLARSNRRASDFVDVAVVLAARERRLADADARARAADEAAARERAEIRRFAAATEERLQAEIREWRRRAVEAEARLLRRVQAGDRRGVASREDEHEEEEGIGARGVLVVAGPSALKKRMLRAWEEDRDALAIVPHDGQVYDLPEASFGTGDVREERTTTEEPNHGGDEDMSAEENDGSDYQVSPENPVPLAVVPPGHDLQLEERGMEEAAGGQEPEAEVTKIETAYYAQPDEPEASEKKNTVQRAPFMKQGMIYKMVFKALKEKERQAILAKPAVSQPSLRCWLYAPPPTEMVAKEEDEEGPGDMDEDAPQQ